jgi:hypothetical protein
MEREGERERERERREGERRNKTLIPRCEEKQDRGRVLKNRA